MSDADNLTAYGECTNAAGHGHQYHVEVTLAGHVEPSSPAVASQALIAHIDSTLRQRLHNADMDTVFDRAGFISTGENVTREIFEMIEPMVTGDVRLEQVRVVETPKNSFIYKAGADDSAGDVTPVTGEK